MTFREAPLRRFVVDACDGPFGSAIASEHYVDEGARVIRLGNIGAAEWNDEDAAFLDIGYWRTLDRHHARAGDVVVAGLGDERNAVGRATVVPELGPALVKADCHRLRLADGVDPRFIAYRLSSSRGSFDAMCLADGSTRKRLTLGKTLSLPVGDVSPERQCRIADFLDVETARIDETIARTQRLVEVLDERTEALVSGLMERLTSDFGEQPLKAVADLRVSNVDKKSYDGQLPVRLCNYTDVYYHREIDSSLDFMVATADPAQVRRLTLSAGDVLITKDSETADDIAVPSLVTEALPDVVLGYHLALLRPRTVDGRFLYWAIRGRRCRDEFSLAASGVTRVGLRQDAMGMVRIPSAPLDEQNTVVAQIERSVRAAEELTTRLGNQIGLLRERRQALITAAVTGELEVA